MLESINKMLSSFETDNITYSHWKSNEHLEEALDGDTDLDILFSPSQRNEIEVILNRCGLKRFRATTHMQYNAIEDFIGFDKQTAKIWHLHLHYRLTLGEKHLKGYTVPWTNYFLDNRVYDNSFQTFRSRPEDEYFLLLLRIALKLRWRDSNKKIGQDDIAEINWLKARSNPQKVIEIAEKLLGLPCSNEYKILLKKDIQSKRELFKLQKLSRSSMKHFTSNSAATSYLRRTIREFYWLFSGVSRKLGINMNLPKRRVSPSGGAVVAILGCDGAGKSTTISYLTKEFGKKIDIKNSYLGSGDGSSSIIRYPMRVVAKRVGGKGVGSSLTLEADNINEKTLALKATAYNFAKAVWAITLAVEKKKKLKDITRARNNGILVVTDRYPQVEVKGYNDGPLLSKFLESKFKILQKISHWESSIYNSAYQNPPDLVIKLMVPTDIAIMRKPEMTFREIENKKAAVKKINLSKNTVEVDTSKEQTSSISEVMEHIWLII